MSTDLAVPIPDTDDLTTYRAEDAPDYSRMSAYELVEIAKLHSLGRTQRQIAAAIGCSQPAVSYALRRMKPDTESVKAAMRAIAPDMIDTWAIKAKQSVDFRGAKEFVEAAHPELRPTPAHSAGVGGVTVIVGTPGAPVRLPDVTIVQHTLSPAIVGVPSEGDENP